jgi:glycosyltransferase involved in cell wall biosynthesis
LRGDSSAHLVLLHDPSKPQHLAWRARLLKRLRTHIDATVASSSRSSSKEEEVKDDDEADDNPTKTRGQSREHRVNEEAEAEAILSRVHFMGRLSPNEFMEVLRRSHVVLDPFPFGGGVTSLESFAVCAPVITCPTCQSVPQLAAGMYRRMQLPLLLPVSPVVSSSEEFVDAALSLLSDDGARVQLNKAICERRQVLFEDTDSVNEWAGFLHRVAATG